MPWQCPACAAERAFPVCEVCGSVRAPAEVEREGYFALFGLPERHAVPRAELERAYLALSRALHPDRHRESPSLTAIRRLAAFANDGYAILRDGVRRAEYLLARKNLPPTVHAPQFLEEQLALREKAVAAGAGERAALRRDAESRLAGLEMQIAAHLNAAGGEPEWSAARKCVDELKYWRALTRLLEAP